MRSAWSILMVALMACQPAAEEAAEPAAEPAAEVVAEPVRMEGTVYGDTLTLDVLTTIAAIKASPAQYIGQRVLVKGQVAVVCKTKGCWLDLVTATDTMQVKVQDDVIVFPQEAIGKQALVEGVVEELQLTQEEAVEAAKERAKDGGAAFDASKITGPMTVYRIRGVGAVIAK